jgi:hypothetical protein
MTLKSLKIGILAAVMFTFFAGTAMAGGRDLDRHRRNDTRGYVNRTTGHENHRFRKDHRDHKRYIAPQGHVIRGPLTHRNNQRPSTSYDQGHHPAQHGLAPRVVFLGPLPILLPPPPHVLLAGRR